MRLIDADALKEEIGFDDNPVLQGAIKGWIDYSPTVDPVKHGHWIVEKQPDVLHQHVVTIGLTREVLQVYTLAVHCSECGRGALARIISGRVQLPVYKYCPECGCKFKEKDDATD